MLFLLLVLVTAGLFATDLLTGSAHIAPSQLWDVLTGDCDDMVLHHIVVDIRLVKAVVALLAGAALAVSGLLMQTLFNNPLAGPYVLGISSGASLGVALVVMAGVAGPMGIAGAAWAGAAVVLVAIAVMARRVRDIMVILVLGMMFSSGVSAVVQVLQYLSDDASLKNFVIWTMGSLGDVTVGQLAWFVPAVAVGLVVAWCSCKPLNQLLLGEEYARTMGLDVKASRFMILMATTLLAGTVTAFCGPIGFIGLAVPHVARAMVRRSDHRTLLPATLLTGAALMLLCDIISKSFTMPVNAITALMGIPVVIWIVLRNR